MINNIKILPMKYPEITSYPFHANLFAILSNYEKAMPWLYNYYIQLEMGPWVDYVARLDFCVGWPTGHLKNCPWLNYNKFSRNYVQDKWSSITEFLIENIDYNNYIYCDVDQFYIPGYINYQKVHVNHDLFIYGYNKEKQLFYVADFFENLAYKFQTITFDEFVEGYQSMENLKIYDYLDGIIVLSFKNMVFYNFDIQLTIELINDYLLSKNSNQRFRFVDTRLYDGFVYGIEIYDLLQKHISYVIEKDTHLDLRGVHVLWDHKKLILFMIEYISRNNYLVNGNIFYNIYKNEIEDLSLQVRNMLIKYYIIKNKTILYRAQSILSEIKDKESDILKNILRHISVKSRFEIITNNNIKNSDFNLIYNGIWNNNEKSNLDFGMASYTNKENASVKILFFGTSITYFATKNQYCGYVSVYIDDERYAIVSLYSSFNVFNEKILTISDLALGYHTVKIICDADKCIESLDNYITLNSFECNTYRNNIIINNHVEFLSIDSSTQGSWTGVYGFDGYDIISTKVLPSYAMIQYNTAKIYCLSAHDTNDIRALHIPDSPKKRMLYSLYDENGYEIELIISGSVPRKISIYSVDLDDLGRKVEIQAIDADTGIVFDIQVLDDITKGIFLCYSVIGHIRFEIRNISSCPALVSGIFFE